MRVIFCWPEISGYMAASWRVLAAFPDVDLCVIAFRHEGPYAQVPRFTRKTSWQVTPAPYTDDVMDDVPCHLLKESDQDNYDLIHSVVAKHRPDVIILPGWWLTAFRRLAFSKAAAKASLVMTMDTPWRGDLRQYIARFVLRRFLRRIDRVAVIGERAWQYARHLGFSEAHILRGAYAYDDDYFDPVGLRRQDWPQRFLFVGRYVQTKGLDILASAYPRYRQQVTDPWPLSFYGNGPLAPMLREIEHAQEHGFIQPAGLPAVYERHGVLILPSRLESWAVVIAEAAATGMPVICTESCGASVEIVRSFTNGLVVPTEDVGALMHAMVWMHEHTDQFPAMGESGRHFAEAFSAHKSAVKWKAMLDELVSTRPSLRKTGQGLAPIAAKQAV